MSDPTKTFTDMFKSLGEQLKVPAFDMHKIMEHHQKNIDAMTRSWQALGAGAQEVAHRQREIFDAAVKDITEMAKAYQPGGSPRRPWPSTPISPGRRWRPRSPTRATSPNSPRSRPARHSRSCTTG